MILMPLFILWANRPMHFPMPLRLAILVAAGFGFSISPIGDLIGRSDAIGGRHAVHAASPQQAVDRSEDSPAAIRSDDRVVIREGTRIPVTAGRITKLGSRWALTIAAARPAATDVAPEAARAAELLAQFRKDSATGGDDAEDAGGEKIELPGLMLLVENLTLQRVVTAVRVDPTDVHWSVTGEVTEFNGENRLILATAQRATPE